MSTIAQPSFETDLELASRVQRALLPKASCCMAAWEIAFSYEAARHVSGDYLDLIEMGFNSFYFLLGDVSGKGVAAALLMAHLHASVRIASAPVRWFLRESDDLFTSMVLVQPHGSGPLSSSLWWRSPPDISSVTFDQDVLCELPSLWGGG